MLDPSAVIAFGYHDQKAPRHWNIKRELEQDGRTVIECHTEERGLTGKYRDLWKQFRKLRNRAGTVIVTFPGHFLMPLAWLLTRKPRMKLIFDAFISLYDTNVEDRRRFAPWHPYAWLLFAVDWLGCHLADEVLIDTEAHRQFFIRTFGLKPEKIRVVYLGTRDDLFRRMPRERSADAERPFDVLFYGTYIPLQGIEHIIRAAALLQKTHPRIRFIFIGRGQTRAEMQGLAAELGCTNIRFDDPVPYAELPARILAADLCLGIFGTSDKAQRVIPHKVYDAAACGTPVLTADTPAIRERFDADADVLLCRAGDPADIAAKISTVAAKTV